MALSNEFVSAPTAAVAINIAYPSAAPTFDTRSARLSLGGSDLIASDAANGHGGTERVFGGRLSAFPYRALGHNSTAQVGGCGMDHLREGC